MVFWGTLKEGMFVTMMTISYSGFGPLKTMRIYKGPSDEFITFVELNVVHPPMNIHYRIFTGGVSFPVTI